MKKITLLLFALFTCWQINAQVSGYSFTELAGTYTENTAGATTIAGVRADSFISTAQNIGFNFVYDGITYTQFKMSSNGFISLNMTGTTSLTTNDLSTANATSRPIIAPLWDDLDGGDVASSVASYELTGTAPNRVLTVEWRNWQWNWQVLNPVISFQVKLYETTNVIEFVYRQEATAVGTGSATIGIGSPTGSGAGSYLNLTSVATPAVSSSTSITNINTKPITGQVYRFTPPSCVAPGGFVASAITTNSATISWNAANPVPSTGYEYYYSDVNTPPAGAGTPTTALTANLSPLNPATVYYVWLRSDCGGTFSVWNGPFTFTTNCVAVTDFVQGFEGTTGALFPTCWAKVGTSGTANTQASTGITGARNLYMYSTAAGSRPVVAMTPVSNANAGTHRMVMKVRANFTVGETIELGYLTNPADANTFTAINSIVTNSTTVPQNFVTIPAGMPAGDVVFALRTGTALYSVLIDDVTWEPIPVTPPTCSTISTPANNALNVAIETNISWAANVDATGYYLQIGYSTGGSEVLANTDLGNVLTYNPPVDFDYSTSYFVTLTPYNANGSAVGCTETTFTTRDAPPTGSLCSDPIIINPATLPYTTTDNTNLYGDDYSVSPCNNNYMGGDDVVYTITPASNMSVDILLSGLGGTWSGIHVLDGCPNTATTCVAFQGNSGSGNRDLQDVLLTGGTTYYIVISTFPSPQSVAYTLTITENTCVNPTVTFSAPNNCPTTNFNAVANITNLGSATSLTVTDNQGSPSQNVTATGNVTFGPFAFGTNVVLTVTNDQDGTCNVVSSNLTVAACPPANDDCANAIVLTPGGVFATYQDLADNTAATNSSQTAPTCASYSGQDIWYSVTVPASGSITIETAADTGSPVTDTGLAVYSGTCAGVTQLDCDDDDGVDNFSLISLTGRTPGEVLLVRAWEYGGGTVGTFLISAYDASLSSSSFDNATFRVYPNPVKDILNLSYTSEISNVQIVNMLGQVVLDRKMNATEGQIDMSALNSGAYIVNVTVGDAIKSIKVIKQ